MRTTVMQQSLLGWILIGLIAGWLAGKVTRGYLPRKSQRRIHPTASTTSMTTMINSQRCAGVKWSNQELRF